MKFDVVIAGGGFAGAYCAKALAKAMGHEEGKKRVALIAERNILVFQPMLAEVAGAALSPTDVVNPLRHFCRGVVVLQGGIHKIDWARRELSLDGGRFTRNHTVGFEHLVLTLGSVTDLSIVPGMKEYGRPMKSVPEAIRLRATVINRLEEANLIADPEAKARLVTFVVVGGGYTGVETAGEVHDLVTGAQRFYVGLRDVKPRVVLVHSRDELLGEIGPKLGAYARKVLLKRGIEVVLETRVTEATATCVLLDHGPAIEACTIISTIGNSPNPVVVDLCKQLGVQLERGRVAVEPAMNVPGIPGLWAAGDCAAVPWNDKGEMKIAPPTAQFAQRQGKQLGQNLFRALRGKPLQPFTHRYMGQLAAIGERQAVAEVFGMHFRGFIAWWMWRTIYLAKLPGWGRRFRVMVDWTFDLFFARDISVMLPPPDEPLRAIHLQSGESLFEEGAQCRAFYYVRKGSLELVGTNSPARTLEAGSVIDQRMLDGNGYWPTTAVALESADVVVFRDGARELLETELRLVAQTPAERAGGGRSTE